MGKLRREVGIVLSGKRILITGGAGFIGSRLAAKLAVQNEVTAMDNLRRGQESLLPKGVRLVKGDVLSAEDCKKAAAGAEIVFHLAAIAGVNTVEKFPAKTLEINLMGTKNALDAALAAGAKKFILSSTSEVYGPNCPAATEGGLTAQGPLTNPRWFYAVSKLAAEALVHGYHREHGIGGVTLRYFNIYGPGQVGEGGISNFCRNAAAGNDLVVRGDGSQIRAWCFVDDCILGTMLAAEKKAADGRIINIGNSKSKSSVLELAKKVAKISHSGSKIRMEPYAAGIEDVLVRSPDVSLAKELLGFEASVQLDLGLSKTLEWFRSQKG